MKFCSACASPVSLLIPAGDNRQRFVCEQCGMIHYSNPNNVCGTILTWQKKILLCKRAIEPRYGLWTLPAGFMENGETITEAAARESLEEANARSEQLDLFGVFSLPHISQVYLMFIGELLNGQASAGEETLETRLFGVDEIPWQELAFPVIGHSLQLFIEQGGQHTPGKVHTATALRHPDHRVEWIQK